MSWSVDLGALSKAWSLTPSSALQRPNLNERAAAWPAAATRARRSILEEGRSNGKCLEIGIYCP